MVKHFLLALLAVALLAGCRPAPQNHVTLTIRGGPSLDALFSDLVKTYQQTHPEVTVASDFTCPPCVLFQRPGMKVNFDLFASLGQFELDRLTQTGQIKFTSSQEVGRTTLALVTSTRAKTEVKSIADLHRPGLRRIGIGDPNEVGVGYYAKQALTKAGLWKELEPSFVYTKSGCELLKWLALGNDIDAAIVFSLCTGDQPGSIRSVIEFPEDLSPAVPLLLGITEQSQNPAEAQKFIEFMSTPEAKAILQRHKVLLPTAEAVSDGGAGYQPARRPSALAARPGVPLA